VRGPNSAEQNCCQVLEQRVPARLHTELYTIQYIGLVLYTPCTELYEEYDSKFQGPLHTILIDNTALYKENGAYYTETGVEDQVLAIAFQLCSLFIPQTPCELHIFPYNVP